MMNIHYRILSIDHKEHSMVVRYWTDLLTEDSLAISDERTPEGYPVRCRTDYNLTIWEFPSTAETIEKQIKQSAPTQWLSLKEYATQEEKSLQHLENHVGKKASFEYEKPVSEEPKPFNSPEIPLQNLSLDEINDLLKSLN